MEPIANHGMKAEALVLIQTGVRKHYSHRGAKKFWGDEMEQSRVNQSAAISTGMGLPRS